MATHSNILVWRIRGTGAWWAAVYGVAQSQTQLKRLSSSSSNFPVIIRRSHPDCRASPFSPFAWFFPHFPIQFAFVPGGSILLLRTRISKPEMPRVEGKGTKQSEGGLFSVIGYCHFHHVIQIQTFWLWESQYHALVVESKHALPFARYACPLKALSLKCHHNAAFSKLPYSSLRSLLSAVQGREKTSEFHKYKRFGVLLLSWQEFLDLKQCWNAMVVSKALLKFMHGGAGRGIKSKEHKCMRTNCCLHDGRSPV